MTIKGDAEQQYGAGFEEWFEANFRDLADETTHGAAKRAWSASALRMEQIKDASLGAKLSQLQIKTNTQITRYEAAAGARMQIHRDDYERAAILIAGLKQIEKIGGQAGTIAAEILNETLVSLRRFRKEK